MSSDPDLQLPTFGRGLSARLLVLTICFVMLSEVLIYAPSIARFRLDWLTERISAGHLAILALEATPDYMIDPQLELQLLDHAGAQLVALRDATGKNLLLRGSNPPPIVDDTVDLSNRSFAMLIGDAFETLFQDRNRVLRVKGQSPRMPEIWIDMVVDEWPLREDMIAYSWRVLGLSIVISLTTAALIFTVLQWLMIRPVRRLTQGMIHFRVDPEHPIEDFSRSVRQDEIGMAEREFAEMQSELLNALKQKDRLAALGTAVGKINHDLRGILATAQLVADRLAHSDNPEVQKSVPALMRSLDRAIELCSNTLNFTREGAPKPELTSFPLSELCGEVSESLEKYLNGAKVWRAENVDGFVIVADRAQLYRVICNLSENALQMGANSVSLHAKREDGKVQIEVRDDGPGLPAKALENLFVPFKGSARAGGSGLGLAIARELMRGQGGDLKLAANSNQGATFLLELPDRHAA